MEIFTPDEGAVEHARKYEAAYSEALSQGIGAITIDGEMVDAASIRIARNIFERVDLYSMSGKQPGFQADCLILPIPVNGMIRGVLA